MPSEIKCQKCGEIYQEGEIHECKTRQELAKEKAVDIDSGHPDD